MQMVQSENERKKEYLKGYRRHVRRINRIETELEELHAMSAPMSASNDGMPHGSGQSDLSGYAAELDKLERSLREEKDKRVEVYKDIDERIKKLERENEKDVLFYRYIAGLAWWEIAEKMNYTERWILKIHGKALAHFRMPKEFIEIQ